jgi:hypothetical protein
MTIADAVSALGDIERALQMPREPGQREIARLRIDELRSMLRGLALCQDCVERCKGEWRLGSRR